ncbi:hypothetical protein B8T70_19395 [Flavobacterium sp. AJR]|nr:hypothetical protein B8T70_19395 [Flavobacterium sp. AJR]
MWLIFISSFKRKGSKKQSYKGAKVYSFALFSFTQILQIKLVFLLLNVKNNLPNLRNLRETMKPYDFATLQTKKFADFAKNFAHIAVNI